ncbi:heme lyase CcmF/NrfE family subunit [Curtanaerobium respiraculi]|uniref:heme lyase CcmF/NrfE family subunit n=1 Tax=Curtanaerobium respiraculi TaxID=2949669 RepID=UPI0024B36A9C|nr:cytochrome c biogenesis protein CcsA [Curtanaerobium respiraculi]
MHLAMVGMLSLLVSLAGIVISVLCLVVGSIMDKKNPRGSGSTLVWGGHVAVLVTFLGLTVACGVLEFCFLSGDTSIEYVVRAHSDADGILGMLYRVSGLWEGKEGSLLFWGWLISLFATIIAMRNLKKLDKLDTTAVGVLQLVLVGFVGILMFSQDNCPFVALGSQYLDAKGNLTGAAALWGINPLLEHWAMAVHPPTLFIGYAGMTVPFAYSVGALIAGDSSDTWVRKSQRYLMVAFWFLTIGIGLGSVWAYVVLGWGGYWGWDPVENASLLPWLISVALIHSFTVYRQRGAFKRWAIMCASIAFAFSVVGTFIARSGLIQSVHAFSGDPVSTVLFGVLIALSLIVGAVGLIIRWKRFAPKNASDEAVESLASREAAYYFNNVLMVVFAFVVLYLTIASALPTWLPFGGKSVATGTYNAIARPLGILYLAVLAFCPLLGWAHTDRAEFAKRAKVPAVFAVALFVALMVYFATYLSPSYDAIIAAGGSMGEGLASEGPAAYYKGLAVAGFLVASVLFFNTLFLIGKTAGAWGASHGGKNPVVGFFQMIAGNASRLGGYIAHLGMAVILIGLVCSSMFVTEKTGYITYDQRTDSAAEFTIQDYTLKYTSNSISEDANHANAYYTVEFDVYRGDDYIGHVAPSMQLVERNQQTKANAAVINLPTEDLFVVYKGVNTEGAYSMDVRVNPQISLVWTGFGMLVVGTAVAALGRLSPKRKPNAGAAEER